MHKECAASLALTAGQVRELPASIIITVCSKQVQHCVKMLNDELVCL